jgi:hypothetical protein
MNSKPMAPNVSNALDRLTRWTSIDKTTARATKATIIAKGATILRPGTNIAASSGIHAGLA